MTSVYSRRVCRAAYVLAMLGASTAPAQVQTPPPAAAAAAETLALTLADAVRRAVEHNPDLVLIRLDTEVNAAQVGQSRGAYAPVLSSTVGRSGNVTPPSNFLLGSSGVTVHDWFTTAGVRQRLPWGAGTWSLSWDSSRTTTNNPITSYDPSLQSGFELAFSQPLLRDRSIDAARHQYIVARRDQQSSELRFREAVVQTVAAVKQAYWTLKATAANVGVQQRSLELAEQLARENKARVDAGQSPPLDLVQAEAEVAQRRESLIRARADAGDAEDRLRRLIIDPSDGSFWHVHLDPVEEPSGLTPLPDVEAAVANALTARFDVARAGYDLENARTDVQYYGNQTLPDVRLETSYRGNGLAGTQLIRSGGFPGPVIGTRSLSFADALGQVFRTDYPTWSVGLTVNYPIGRSYETASLARAEVERRQAAQRVAALRLDAAENVRRAGRQMRSTAERMDSARASATLAEQRLDAEQRRYEVGLSTTFLVTQAQRDLLQAQVNLLQTRLDYESALVNFEAVQEAPPLSEADATIGLQGSTIVRLPTSSPRGIFRVNSASPF